MPCSTGTARSRAGPLNALGRQHPLPGPDRAVDRDDLGQVLPVRRVHDLGHARGDDDVPVGLDLAAGPHDEQRVADLVGGAPRRLDGEDGVRQGADVPLPAP